MRLMYLQVKTAGKSRIKLLTDKQATSKVLMIFVNVKMLKDIQQGCF